MIQFESKPDSSESNYSQHVRIFCCEGWVKKPKAESIFLIKPFTSSINHQPEANRSPPFTFSSRFLLSELQPLHLITWPTLPSQICQTLTARPLCCRSAIITGQCSRRFPNRRQLWNTSVEGSYPQSSISVPHSQYLETVRFLQQTPHFFLFTFCCFIRARR